MRAEGEEDGRRGRIGVISGQPDPLAPISLTPVAHISLPGAWFPQQALQLAQDANP